MNTLGENPDLSVATYRPVPGFSSKKTWIPTTAQATLGNKNELNMKSYQQASDIFVSWKRSHKFLTGLHGFLE